MKKILLSVLVLLCIGLGQAFSQCTPDPRACEIPDTALIPFCITPVELAIGTVGEPFDQTFQIVLKSTIAIPNAGSFPFTKLQFMAIRDVPPGLTVQIVSGNASDAAFNNTYPYELKQPNPLPLPGIGIHACIRVFGTPTAPTADTGAIFMDIRPFVRVPIFGETNLIELAKNFLPDSVAEQFPDPLPLPLPVVIRMPGGDVPTVNAGDDQSICNGDSLRLVPDIQPIGNYEITWEPPTGLTFDNPFAPLAKPTQTTSYTLSVSTGDTIIRDTVVITVFGNPSLTLTNTQNISCDGSDGSISMSIAGGTAPYEIYLNDMLEAANVPMAFTTNISSANTYVVTVRDANGCSDEAEAIIEGSSEGLYAFFVFKKPKVTPNRNNGVIFCVARGGVGGLEYSVDGNTFMAPGIFRNLRAGTYTVTARDQEGCTSTREVILD